MDQTRSEPAANESNPSPTSSAFGAADVAVIADALSVDEPAVAVIGLALFVPFAILDLARAIGPVARRVGEFLDYRRYLNGGTW